MKKLIILILCAVSLESTAQDRNVFWAHGLNSDGDFWNTEYARAQRDFRIRSRGFSYPTNEGVPAYADRLRSGSSAIKGSQTIAIGHSMGAVGIREADRDDSGLYGGMITFGGPLDGARIANEVIAGTPIDRFVANSIETMRRGPIASDARSKWRVFVNGVNDVVRGDGLSAILRTFASAPILDVTEDLTGGFNQVIRDNYDPNSPSVRDLAEGSAYFNTIRNYASSKPKIFAWGDEDSPVHIRMFISSITFDNNFSNLLLTTYNQVANGYKAAADGIDTGGGLFCWSKCKEEKRREKEAWNVGYDYLNRGWEIAWNQLTDARFLERYTTTERVYKCDGNGPLRPQPLEPIDCQYPGDDCGGCYWVTETVTRTRWVNQPSDGLIKQSSQIGEVSRWGGQAARLDGVNHLEMGIHPETNELLERAFRGGYNPFFTTSRR